MANARFIDVEDVAARYGIGVSTTWRWVKRGLIPAPIKMGRLAKWSVARLDAHDEIMLEAAAEAEQAERSE